MFVCLVLTRNKFFVIRFITSSPLGESSEISLLRPTWTSFYKEKKYFKIVFMHLFLWAAVIMIKVVYIYLPTHATTTSEYHAWLNMYWFRRAGTRNAKQKNISTKYSWGYWDLNKQSSDLSSDCTTSDVCQTIFKS